LIKFSEKEIADYQNLLNPNFSEYKKIVTNESNPKDFAIILSVTICDDSTKSHEDVPVWLAEIVYVAALIGFVAGQKHEETLRDD